jgi:hypothetical protein
MDVSIPILSKALSNFEFPEGRPIRLDHKAVGALTPYILWLNHTSVSRYGRITLPLDKFSRSARVHPL